MNFFNNLLYKLASKYLSKTQLTNLVANYDYKDRKKQQQELAESKIQMEKYLATKGDGFMKVLEEQDHVGYLVQGASHHKTSGCTPPMHISKE